MPEFYVDDGYSAKDMKRPQLQRLLEDVQRGDTYVVITTKLDRLSRKLYETLKMVETLQRHNTRYYCCNIDIDFSTPQGMLMLQQMGSFAEFEREMIRERVRDNLQSIAKKSSVTKKTFTRPCYGYNIVDGKYIIDPKQAEIVRMSVDMSMQGIGCRNIAKHLNELGMLTRYNKTWTETQIRLLLSRETLSGKIVYNRTYKKNGRTYVRPESEWIIIEDHHEPIIDEASFEELQAVMSTRKVAHKQADNSRWLLSGLIYCTHCGSKMKGVGYRDPNKFQKTSNSAIYLCSNYHKSGGCFHHFIRKNDVEGVVVDHIQSIAQGVGEKIVPMVAPRKEVVNERKLIEDQLRKIDQKMQKQIEAFEEDLISASDLKKARERLDQQRAALLSSLESMNEVATTNQVHSNVNKLLPDVLSTDRIIAKRAIRRVIERIEITDGSKVEIVFRNL